MEIYPLDIVIHIINIVVLYILLRLLIYKPVRKFMLDRSARVQKQLDDAEKLLTGASAEKAEYDLKIENADETVRQIIRDGEKKARENADLIIGDAKSQAELLIAHAKEDAANEAAKALESVHDEIAGAAVDIAGKILSREIKIEDNKAIIRSFFESN